MPGPWWYRAFVVQALFYWKMRIFACHDAVRLVLLLGVGLPKSGARNRIVVPIFARTHFVRRAAMGRAGPHCLPPNRPPSTARTSEIACPYYDSLRGLAKAPGKLTRLSPLTTCEESARLRLWLSTHDSLDLGELFRQGRTQDPPTVARHENHIFYPHANILVRDVDTRLDGNHHAGL